MRPVLKFLIQLGVIIFVIWLLAKYTTLDDRIISFFRANSSTSIVQTGSVNNGGVDNGSNNGNNNWGGQVAGASCITPWGETLNDGAYIIAYESTSSCRFEKRYCDGGILQGSYSADHCNSNAGWQYATTTPQAVTVNYGYVQAIPQEGQYEGPSRTSANGITTVISSRNNQKSNPTTIYAHDSSYIKPVPYKNYDLTQHGCTTPWGTYMDSSTSVIAYKSSTPAYKGASCTYERRTCFQGMLGGSYVYPSCSIADNSHIYDNHGQDYFYPVKSYARSCTTPWWQTVKDGGYVYAYKSSNSSYGYACQGEYRYCKNGVLQGSYRYSSCNNNHDNGRNCSLPWGGSISNGSSVTAYSNQYGPCYSQTRTCNNGYLNGSYQYSYCNAYHEDNRRCNLPWGGSIADGSSVTAYSSSTSPCSSQTRTCNDWHLNGSYQHASCVDKPVENKSCTTPWWQIIAHGAKVEAYQTSSAPCYKEIRSCSNGYLGGSFQYNYCNPGSTQGGTDTYGSWQSVGDREGNIDSQDTCNANATSPYVCGSESSNSCTDYAKISCSSFSPMICSYQTRSVSCVK